MNPKTDNQVMDRPPRPVELSPALLRIREDSREAWLDLLGTAQGVMPGPLWEYFDRESTWYNFTPRECWVIFQQPGGWPIMVQFTRGVQWVWSPLEDYSAQDDSIRPPWYAVVLEQGTMWEQTLCACGLGAALILAQKQPRNEEPPW